VIDFASVLDDDQRFANGITVGDDGTIYVTDTGAGVIYAVDSSYTPSVFAADDAFEPVRTGPTASGVNGIVSIGDALIVGHSPTGELLRVSLSDPTRVEVIATGVDGMSIDGLHLSDDGSTLAVVSNLDGVVHLFESNDGWTTATQVSRFETGATFPTSVTDRDGDFYVLQAHLDQLPDLSFDTFEIVPVAEE
jgi:sugar lactone lactonase YvrE